LILVFAFPLAFFPKRLPKQNTDANKQEEVERLKEGFNLDQWFSTSVPWVLFRVFRRIFNYPRMYLKNNSGLVIF
jgi:hypothetical protein